MYSLSQLGKIDQRLFIAPMASVTSLSFRIFCREFNKDIITCTELISAKSIEKTLELKKQFPTKLKAIIKNDPLKDRPCGIQLFGFDIPSFKVATNYINETYPNFDFIDINMGCPVRKVVNPGAGAALLKKENFSKTKEIIKAVVTNTDLPVSIKIRLGWKKPNFDVKRFLETAYENGCSFVTVHARYADDNYSTPPIKQDIEKLTKLIDCCDIPIVFNDDIKDHSEAKEYWSMGFKGVMIGRAIKANPYCLVKETENSHRIEISEEQRILDFVKLIKLTREYNSPFKDLLVHIKMLKGIIPKKEFDYKLLNRALNQPLEVIENCLIEKRSLLP